MTARPREPDDDVLGPCPLDLEPRVAIEDRLDHLAHVVGGSRVDRHDLVQALDRAVGGVARVDERRGFGVARRKIGKKAAHGGDAVGVGLDLVVADARLVAVDLRAAHIVVGHVFPGRGLDEARTA